MPDWFPPRVCRHLMATGALGLLFVYPEVNAVAGALFGVGFVWWRLGRFYGYSFRAWLVGGPV